MKTISKQNDDKGTIIPEESISTPAENHLI